jgi:hypothetical protein
MPPTSAMLPKNERPRQDRDEAGRDRSLVGSCGVSRLPALADQAGINDFERAAPPSAGLSEIQLGAVKSVHRGTQIAQCKPQV